MDLASTRAFSGPKLLTHNSENPFAEHSDWQARKQGPWASCLWNSHTLDTHQSGYNWAFCFSPFWREDNPVFYCSIFILNHYETKFSQHKMPPKLQLLRGLYRNRSQAFRVRSEVLSASSRSVLPATHKPTRNPGVKVIFFIWKNSNKGNTMVYSFNFKWHFTYILIL